MDKKCLFFCASGIATGAETTAITRLEKRGYNVQVRNALIPAAYTLRETADAVAGTLPTVVSDNIADYPDGNVTMPDVLKAEAIKICAAGGVSFAAAGSKQLTAVKADLTEDESEAVALTEITSGANSAWGTSDAGKATVNSAGLVSGVGAGAVIITLTYTYDVGKTQTATINLTVT